LEQLTAAVDEKLEGFEKRERELEAELTAALEDKARLEEEVQRGPRRAAESPRVARLAQMAESVGLKQEETMEVLKRNRQAEEITRLTALNHATEAQLAQLRGEKDRKVESLKREVATLRAGHQASSSHGGGGGGGVVAALGGVEGGLDALREDLRGAMSAREQSQAELRTLKILYESLQVHPPDDADFSRFLPRKPPP